MPFEPPPWPPRWAEIGESVAEVIESGDWGRYQTEICRHLQDRLATQFGALGCRLTCSGTAAIELALRACRVGPGDEVIVSGYDYPGHFRSIELLGATPVLVDVAADSPCIDVGQLPSAASDRVVAVIATHLYGRAADIETLREICDANGWVLIEDACQVPGMMIRGRPAGSFGDFATVSFGGSKPITAGSGGALLNQNERLAARLPAIVDRPSDTYPLSALQAATIGPQLDRLDALNQQRAATARFLMGEFPGWDWIGGEQPDVTPAYYKLAWRGHWSRSELPIGKGFRTTAMTSDRRCRKPVALDRSIELAQRCCLLDHRALMIEPDQYTELASAFAVSE